MRRNWTRWMTAALGALLLTAYGAGARAEGEVEPARVVVIEMQKVLETSVRGKESKRILEEEFKRRQATLTEREDKIKAKMKELEEKQMILTEEALNGLRDEIEEMKSSVMEDYKKYSQELDKKDRELTATVLKEVEEIILKVAKGQGADIILSTGEGSVLWASQRIDITDRVIQLYDEKIKAQDSGGE